MIRPQTLFTFVLAMLCIVSTPVAFGAPAEKKAPATSPEDAEARAHFKAGSEYFDNGDYREAYDEFRKAMALKKTRAVMGFAASSLRQMGRYDESLDLYEAILHDYKDLPRDFKSKVDTAIADLTKLVGTLSVTGDAPNGGALFVDDRPRGVLPLAAPIRVTQGMHTIRVQKEGFAPIVGSLEVVPGKNNTVTLAAKSKLGRMVVEEKHNWPLAVELDGKDVGVTPWQGLVEPGEHRIRLHGFIALGVLAECAPPEAGVLAPSGAKMVTPEQTVTVQSFESSTVTFGAEDADASLRIDVEPKGSVLRIDGNAVGQTPWEGRLPLGTHTVEVNNKGFVTARRTVRLERRKEREINVSLEREPDVTGQRRTRNVTAGLGFGVSVVGLGIFAVSGGLAMQRLDEIQSRCGGLQCPAAETLNVDGVRALGTMSTVGIVVAGFGIAAGTVAIVTLGPKNTEEKGKPPVTMQMGFGVKTAALSLSF